MDSILIVKLFLVSLVVLGIIGMGMSYGQQSGYEVASVEWSKASYSGFEGTKANVTVVDPEMNKYPNAIDYLWVSLHSDSDPDLFGTRMTLFETNFDSGIFQREITFTETPPSGGGFLHVVTGDTILAKYVDTTYPANFSATDLRGVTVTEQGIEVSASSIIVGKRGPPLERTPAYNLTLFTLSREPIPDNAIVIDQQVRIGAYLENQQNRTQPFAYLVQIQNEHEQVESLSWITGNLTSFQKLNPDVTWIPFQEGMYRVSAFVWESVNNPTALSPPLSFEIIVKSLQSEPEIETKEQQAKIDEEWPTGGILRYEKTPPIIDETYHLRSVKGWQDFSREQLMTEHAIFGDEFFTELGRLLVKNEMTYQLQRLDITNANDDFNVYVGLVEESLPPHIYFEAVVNGTDNNTYRLQGAAHANRVNYYKTEVLEFYDITKNIPVESILTQPQLITILPEDGHNPRAKPTNAIIHLADNKLEFFNNSPHTVRIQDDGSGKISEEHELEWIGPTIEPNQSGFVSFNGTGFYEWDARTPPEPDRLDRWGSYEGGRIVVLSLNTNSLPLDVKMKMAGTIIMESEIPRASLGMGNNRGLDIGFNRAIYEMLPDAEIYYKARAEQLIPFDVPVIIEEPHRSD